MQHRTTETLRDVLFQTLDDLREHKISDKDALAVCKLSAEIVKTAELELRMATTVSALDKQDQGVGVGPLLLTAEKKEQ